MYESLVAEYLDYRIPPYRPRKLDTVRLPEPARGNIIRTIVGVRRCGKTYALYQLMDELAKKGIPRERLFYFPFDDERVDAFDREAPSQVMEAYYKLVPAARDGCYLFFDEIQEAAHWEGFVRRVAEQNPATVVITGSSSKLLSVDLPTKLRGRSLSIDMWPLSFPEFCSFRGIVEPETKLAYSSREKGMYETAFDDFLKIGGFPGVQALDVTDRVRMLQAYADEIVTKDVLERFGSSSYRVGRRFARSALRSTGLRFSVNKQVKALRSAGLSISSEAAYSLLDDFDDAHLVFKVTDYSLSIKDNPKSAYKLYSVDQGLSLAIAPASHLDLGQRLETAVYIELKRRYGGDRDNVISRYSSARCPEVDFVVGDVLLTEQYHLIQVTADSGVTRATAEGEIGRKYKSEVGNLGTAMAETGLGESTLLTLDEEGSIQLDSGIVHVLPTWQWMLESMNKVPFS